LGAVKAMLAGTFSVGHVTLELETAGGECAGSSCAFPPAGLPAKGEHTGHRH
jgi:hypothetical protein